MTAIAQSQNLPPAFNRELIARYDKSGPRYTSYPTADRFHDRFDASHYRHHALRSNTAATPLSLYVHIPFCNTICYYCACNKVVTKKHELSDEYLPRLYREIELQSQLFDDKRIVEQLHWGGGTPTFLNAGQLTELMSVIREHFALADDKAGDFGIEADPRTIDPDSVQLLRDLGFNRLSLGVQDLNAQVQLAVNRIHPYEQIESLMQAATAARFHSVNIDLIYGLPLQTVTSFLQTLSQIVQLGPQRLSIFNYAHLPERFKAQRRIRAEDLPSPADKLEMLRVTIEYLTGCGYVYVGMDHFAKADDELVKAQSNGTLHRNFQGYSTHGNCDLIGLGNSAIGKIGDCYAQNNKVLEEYYRSLDNGELPINRGLELDADDRLRREVISQLMCHNHLDIGSIERQFGIDFAQYFASELQELQPMQTDGLLTLMPNTLVVSASGRLLIRHIAMAFDAWLRCASPAQPLRYSRLI